MKPKLPLISYIVTTRFLTNSEGLRYLHKEVFTDEDPRISKNKAVEYYNAAIECLADTKEILVHKSDTYSKEKIVYKDPEAFNGGVAIFLRLNTDAVISGNVYHTGRTFLINVFCDLDKHIAVKRFTAKKIEQQFWNKMSSSKFSQQSTINDLLVRKGIKKDLRDTKLLERISLADSSTMQLIKNVDEIELIPESICAFLNTDGGEIVIGIDEHLMPTGFLTNVEFKKYKDVFSTTVFTMFSTFTEMIEFDTKQINGTLFYYLKIEKSATPAFLSDKDGCDFYYRNLAGNVRDFDRTD